MTVNAAPYVNAIDRAIAADRLGSLGQLSTLPYDTKAELYPEYYGSHLAYQIACRVTLTPVEDALLPLQNDSCLTYQAVVLGPTKKSVASFQRHLAERIVRTTETDVGIFTDVVTRPNEERITYYTSSDRVRKFEELRRARGLLSLHTMVAGAPKRTLVTRNVDEDMLSKGYYFLEPTRYDPVAFDVDDLTYYSVVYLGYQSPITSEDFTADPEAVLYPLVRKMLQSPYFDPWDDAVSLDTVTVVFVDENSDMTAAYSLNVNWQQADELD